jgi:hypothetical protein
MKYPPHLLINPYGMMTSQASSAHVSWRCYSLSQGWAVDVIGLQLRSRYLKPSLLERLLGNDTVKPA